MVRIKKNEECKYLLDTLKNLKNKLGTLLQKLQDRSIPESDHSTSKDLEKLCFFRQDKSISSIGKKYLHSSLEDRKIIKTVQILFYNFGYIYPFWILAFFINKYGDKREISKKELNYILGLEIEEIKFIVKGEKKFSLCQADEEFSTFYIRDFLDNLNIIERINSGTSREKIRIKLEYIRYADYIFKVYPKLNKESNFKAYRELYESDNLNKKIETFLLGNI